ncbi:MAG TPA: hypothetical protein VGY97_13245 [Solirubrobacteraceae bacterium]|nr:hypothetical protein [Solirubrobacteraceae bacterium]
MSVRQGSIHSHQGQVRVLACVIAFALIGALAPTARAAVAPPALSADRSGSDIASAYGSGVFGAWTVDGFGMPAYRYTLDQQTSPAAVQPELAGRRDAWHQLGNGRALADAFNRGYVQLWSQDRIYQWTNYYDGAHQHFAGGYGYLNVDGHAYSTLYDDRPAGAATQRDFGIGYYAKQIQVGGIDVQEKVYPPLGDDPLLLHDVTLTNSSSTSKHVAWFEYWDVNPYIPGIHSDRSLAAPAYDAATQTLSVAQLPSGQDTDPLSIFAAALSGPVDGFDTDASAFFGPSSGDGGRASPAAVVANHLSGSIAPPSPGGGSDGSTMFAFRSPVTLAPGQTVTLRYAYGYGHPSQIPTLVSRYRAASDPFTASEHAWSRYLPQSSFGSQYAWLSRELQWDAYMVRSGATYEEGCGHHIISQGGYYQYDNGFQAAFRDPLQHMLPMIYADPGLAREVLLYSAHEQPPGGAVPWGIIPLCQRFDLGTSNDLDLWLLWAASEYGLASRDLQFFDQPVTYFDGSSGSFWDHLKLAYQHQESQLGPHGDYVTGATGDWSDFSTQFLQMTESTLVTAQLAYVYPRLAELADARGDHAFAQQLRATGARDLDTVRREWTGQGWYSRGYSGARQLGQGAIFGEPQPWGILAGAPTGSQAGTLVANIRRYLQGVGAPAALHGPAKIGSSQSPAASDPGVTEQSEPPIGQFVGTNNAVWVGGSWYAINGALTWALAQLAGTVPHAIDYAFDEFLRNTLTAHATAYPSHWDGVISVDDVCRSFYSANPEICGTGLSTNYEGQIMHQPAWSLFDAIRLVGIDPVQDGYQVTPHLPMATFSLRLPEVGVASQPGLLRGYVRPQQGATLRMHVAAPPDSDLANLTAFANGREVPSSVQHGLLVFDLPAPAGQAADWAVAAPGAAAAAPGARTQCVAGRHFRVRLGVAHRRLRRATVYVNGRRFRVVSGRRLRRAIDLRRLPAGVIRLRVVRVTRAGKRITTTRTYYPCGPHGRTRAHGKRRPGRGPARRHAA